MVELNLTTEDLEFKKSREFPGKEPLINAAMALETTKAERTPHSEDARYDRRSSVGVLMAILGWDGGVYGIARRLKNSKEAFRMRTTLWQKSAVDSHQYRQRVIYMISGYVVHRIDGLDRDNKTNREVADWLRLLAAD